EPALLPGDRTLAMPGLEAIVVGEQPPASPERLELQGIGHLTAYQHRQLEPVERPALVERPDRGGPLPRRLSGNQATVGGVLAVGDPGVEEAAVPYSSSSILSVATAARMWSCTSAGGRDPSKRRRMPCFS